MSKCDKHNTNFTIHEVHEYPGKTIEVCLDCERERLARMRELFTPRHGCGPGVSPIVEPNREFDAVANENLFDLCGPGNALPPDTHTEGARLPRKTREELIEEYEQTEIVLMSDSTYNWERAAIQHQRLADLAGQIAGMDK